MVVDVWLPGLLGLARSPAHLPRIRIRGWSTVPVVVVPAVAFGDGEGLAVDGEGDRQVRDGAVGCRRVYRNRWTVFVDVMPGRNSDALGDPASVSLVAQAASMHTAMVSAAIPAVLMWSP